MPTSSNLENENAGLWAGVREGLQQLLRGDGCTFLQAKKSRTMAGMLDGADTMLAAQAWRSNQTDLARMTDLSEAPKPAIEKHLSHPKYRPDIDGLRAIAVLSVVAFHAFPSLIQGGFVGVDVFFVISGFLISSIIFGSLEKSSFSFVDFYSRRVNRIFPALLLVLASTWAFGWFSLLADEYTQLGKHIAGGAAFVSNLVLLGEAGYFDNSAETKLLLHLWSLGIEEQFYLVWPLMVWAAWKFRINALILIVLVGGISFALNVMNVHADPVATFYSPQSRFWELLVGSLLAYLSMHKPQLFPSCRDAGAGVIRNIQSLAGLSLLGAAFALTTKSNQFPGWWAILPTVGAALIIAAGPLAWFNRKVLSSRLLVWFGLISFPLYLWHWPLLTFARISSHGDPLPETRGALVVASFILAWLTYFFVERPLRIAGKPKLRSGLLCAITIIIFSIGATTYHLNGIDSRFPLDIRHIANFNYDFKKDSRAGTCWLSTEQPFNGFSNECSIIKKPSDIKSIVLWGDSHSGRLYPGLRKVLDDGYIISEFVRDSCPPILNYAYENCIKSNTLTMSEIQKIQPDTVILFAVWNIYQPDWFSASEAKTGLLNSINQLKNIGIKNILVIGPAPHWPSALPSLVYDNWKNSKKVADRMPQGLNPSLSASDKGLSDTLRELGVHYVSLIDYLCSEKGCLTYVPGSPNDLFTWDYGHFTTEGAKFVAEHIVETGTLE